MDFSLKHNIHPALYQDILSVAEASLPWEQLQDSHILITGANGFIGYYLAAALLLRNDLYNQNIQITGLVRNLQKASAKFGVLLERNDLKLMVQDVCDEIHLAHPADYIIHAASQASAYHYETDPVGTMTANLTGTIKVLEAARESCSKSAVLVSSLKVYGTVYSDSVSLKESDIGYIDHTSYKNCYALGKRAAETLCASFHKQYGLPVKIARPAYIYGASTLEDDRVWAQFIANIVRKENILLKSSGAPLRSFCYVADTASALLTILLKGEDVQPYNIAAAHSDTTIRNFARTAVSVFPERKLTLSFANPEDEKEPLINPAAPVPEILDSTALHRLGWTAGIDLKEGIRRSVCILEANNL